MPDSREPAWITADEVEEIARVVVENTSETFQVRDRGALEGAISRPLNAWLYEDEVDIIVLAVRLIEGIGQSHCFEQGNKRTAFFAGLEFIEANGTSYEVRDGDDLGLLVERVIIRQSHPNELVAALRKRVKF